MVLNNVLLLLVCLGGLAIACAAAENVVPPPHPSDELANIEKFATQTGATVNKAPGWIKHGAYVYRICTPDNAEFLDSTEAGIAITSNLLDGSIQQIPMINGLISDDHNGLCNWDGIWPYWNRVSYRAKSWDNLHGFMQRVSDNSNTKISFHVNLTDVNIGMKAFPETQAYFKKLVETKSIYRRDLNNASKKRDIEPPYVPQDFPKDETDPISIFALVNYKNFWDSGLAKQMIDEFYGHLPYSPPVLYLDVLTLDGGNFSTGFPDGPLGGSKDTQEQGVLAIADYLRTKGTEVGTEGDRNFMKDYGTYGWLHCQPGYSADDYSKIKGAAKGARVVTQHVYGNTGCFVVTPVASSTMQIAKVRGHYTELLAGAPITRKMPGLDTWHISDRGGDNDEFNMMGNGYGGGDPFRGDWIDLVNGFYLTGIQELYHIGKGNVRTAVFETIGNIHVSKFGIVDANGKETEFRAFDCLPPDFPDWGKKSVKESGRVMMESPLTFRFNAPAAGKYHIKLYGNKGGRNTGNINIYVDKQAQLKVLAVPFQTSGVETHDLGELTLQAGDNTILADSGAIYAKWSDGTEAVWATPSTGKGFKVTNGDVTFADDYDRMWPDSWSGQKKIYFYSWDGTQRTWKLPLDWATVQKGTLYPLTPDGRGKGIVLTTGDRTVAPKLLPQIPYVFVPAAE